MTLFLIAAASVAIVWAPAMRIFRVSGAVAILALGIPGFAILAGLLFRPSVSEMSGLDHAPNAFYVSGQAWNAVAAFSAIGAAVFLGGLGVSLVLMLFKDNSSLAEHGPLVIELPARAIWISLIALISQIIGVGPATVLKSDSYLASTGPSFLLKIGNALLPLAVLVAANIKFAKRSTRSTRLAAGVVLILLEIYLLGQATRTFSVFFVLVFVGGWLTGRWSNRQSILIGVGAALIALITLGLPLTLRGLPQHGLLPSLQYLAASPGEAFSGDSNPLYNALLGVPLSMYEFTQIPPIGTRALWVSLNPLPGGSSGWTKLAPDLRLNQYEPFSAIGEVLNHGWRVALLVAAALGAVLQLLAAVARSTPGRWGSAAYALILGIAGLILIRCTQYNLRTSARLIYFLVFAVTALAVVGHVLAGQRRSRPSVSTEVVSRGDQPQVSA